MPFTVSHAAAALPVRGASRWLPLDALVIGTMSPDFEYVLRLAVIGRFGHTPLGLLLFCIPVSLAAVALFRALVRPALLPLIPRGAADRLRATVPANALVPVLAAILIGALTHVAWDGFTHKNGWAVEMLPGLRASAAALGIGRPWYNVLQHASTLVGAAVLALWAAAWLRNLPADARRFAPEQLRRAARVVGTIGLATAVAGVANGARAMGSGPEWMLGYAAVGAMAGLAAALVVYGLIARPRAGGADRGAGRGA